MAYIAPEVILRQGYTFTPDWWSLGVTLYEVLFGVRPYNGRNGQELMANVEKGEVPEFFLDSKGKCSPMCVEVLRGVSGSPFLFFCVRLCPLLKLVEKNKDSRLCCKDGNAGLSEIKKMSWFDGMDWKLLEAKKIIPPMRPDVSVLTSTVFVCHTQSFRQGKGNFDPAHELEEILLEDNPLRAKRRTKEFDTMSPEMKRMEEQCVLISFPIRRRKADHPTRFIPYNFRHTVVERSQGSSSSVSAVPHRPMTPGTPIIDRGFESMIDHKSIINQRIDTPLARPREEKDSVESHELNPIPPPFPNAAVKSADGTDNLPGELKTTRLIHFTNHKLTPALLTSGRICIIIPTRG